MKLPGSALIDPIARRVKAYRDEARWRQNGSPAPPPYSIKRRFLLRNARAAGLSVFVETGTLSGDTVAAMRPRFRQVHSIELSDILFEKARHRFRRAANVHLWHGDSGVVMPQVIGSIREPILFWLDGHYSGGGTARGTTDTPIMQELEHIRRHELWASHLIVIDDARLFDGTDYPALADLRSKTSELGFDQVHVETDMIVVRA